MGTIAVVSGYPRRSVLAHNSILPGRGQLLHQGDCAENYAKFWLNPFRLADSIGYNKRELRQLERIVEQHQVMLTEAWDGFFNG